MSLLIGSLTIGFILSLLAVGVYISFRIFDFADITAEGSITLGAAVTAVLLVHGWSPMVATPLAFVAGALAGAITGVLAMRFQINRLLSGILTMTALYSVNLRIMGKANMPLSGSQVIYVSDLSRSTTENLLYSALLSLAIVVVIKVLLDFFMRTYSGMALLAVGKSEQLVRTLSINTGRLKIAGLMLANGLTALSGSMMAQYQHFADVGMGTGTVVIGLASVIIGRAVFGRVRFIQGSTSVIFGSIIYKIGVGLALKAGLAASDTKILTAAFFVLVIVLQMQAGHITAGTRKLAAAVKKVFGKKGDGGNA